MLTAPATAVEVFGERLPLVEAYVEWLCGAGIARGLLGPREADRAWTRHVMNCAAVAPLLPAGARVADVGSGAGLPGIPLALARPDARLTLIEPLQRRVRFLTDVQADLGLDVEIVQARADAVTAVFDVVVSRAVAPLDRLAAWCLPLLRDGGTLLAIKGSSAVDELALHGPALSRSGLHGASVLHLEDGCGGMTTVIRAERALAARPNTPAHRNEVVT